MIKLSVIRLGEKFFNLINAIYRKIYSSVILGSKRLNAFSPKSVKIKAIFMSFYSKCTENLASATFQIEIKGIKKTMKRIKTAIIYRQHDYLRRNLKPVKL